MSANTNPYAAVQAANLDFYEQVLVTLTKAHETVRDFPEAAILDNDVRAIDASGEMVDPWDHRAVQWSPTGLLQVHDWKYVEFWENHDYRPGVEPPDLFPSDAAINFANYELSSYGGLKGIADRPRGRGLLQVNLFRAKCKLEARLDGVRAVKRGA